MGVDGRARSAGHPVPRGGDGDVRQAGDNRRFDGGADVRLFYRTGPEAAVVPPGATRVAYVSASEDADAIAVFVEPFADG